MAKDKSEHINPKKPVLNTSELTSIQMEILDMFANKQLSEKEENEIKDLLSNYFLEKAQEELESVAEKKNWDLKAKSASWGKEKLRTPYRREGSS